MSIIHRVVRIGGAVGAATLLAGCGLSSAGGLPGGSANGTQVTITQEVAPSALLTVMNGPASGPALFGLVASTARPNEDVSILEAGTPGTTIVASGSPAPAQIVIPGPPVAPGGGQTDYQTAQYAKKLKAWRAKHTAAVQAEAAETHEKVSAWLGGLGILRKISELADPPAAEGSLTVESAVAANALADLEEGTGNVFGDRRVIVLFCNDLSGGDTVPPGELTGDDVVVVTRYLPAAADASAAQVALLAAGAAQAAVVESQAATARLTALVSTGLSQGVKQGDSVSTPILFSNDSHALSAAAVTELTRLLPRLREAGATAVINGFASTPGTAEANYILSFERATSVAYFFESNSIPESSLIIVGHGATDLTGSGASGANRRVIVVIEP
jgi:outer membrane protein OmpA-like peptidoglycan-associated protein